jgi:hypothetical protein
MEKNPNNLILFPLKIGRKNRLRRSLAKKIKKDIANFFHCLVNMLLLKTQNLLKLKKVTKNYTK